MRPGVRSLPASCPDPERSQTNAPKVDYQKDIQPILEKNCYSCHGATAQMSGLRLDSRQAFLAGGTNGKIVVPGKRRTARFTSAWRASAISPACLLAANPWRRRRSN